MPNPARRIIALAVLAVAIVAGAVALDLPSAAAQSDGTMQTEELIYGKITARRVADDQIEFGWQPTTASGKAIGPRVFPRARFLPQNAEIDRWLSSSPVKVGGAAIGRINARMLSGGRIEFGFTPTDGARILPPSRYFPHNAERGRWLRSTTIPIPIVPRDPFTAIDAGYLEACGVRESGAIACWGWNFGWEVGASPGHIAVSVGNQYACRLDNPHRDGANDGLIRCWGKEWAEDDSPTGRFSAVSAGSEHACAIRTATAEIECWGSNNTSVRDDASQAATTVEGVYVYRPAYSGQAVAPAGRFTAVSAGDDHTCGLRESGAIECWGRNLEGQTDAPAGRFMAVSAGFQHTCGLRESGAIECWGRNLEGQTDVPAP